MGVTKYVLCGAVLGGIAFAAGCTLRPNPPVAVEADGGPVVYDDYYYSGYYDGPVYYWHDRYGHLRHEERACTSDARCQSTGAMPRNATATNAMRSTTKSIIRIDPETAYRLAGSLASRLPQSGPTVGKRARYHKRIFGLNVVSSDLVTPPRRSGRSWSARVWRSSRGTRARPARR